MKHVNVHNKATNTSNVNNTVNNIVTSINLCCISLQKTCAECIIVT